MSISETRCSTAPELTQKLAARVESELRAAIANRGQASLVVSGGNTPKALFEALAGCQLTWHKVTITLADERWVDQTSEHSNESMLRQTLLQGYAAEARFIPLKNNAETARQGQPECEQVLRGIGLPFDLVILGMGDDGHTASLFPGVSGAALDVTSPHLCQSIVPPVAPYERMTLTANALLTSREILLHIVGKNKWQVYCQATSAGAIDEMPIRVVLQQDEVPVGVYWSP
jgi:6-phosphogluconolactonase